MPCLPRKRLVKACAAGTVRPWYQRLCQWPDSASMPAAQNGIVPITPPASGKLSPYSRYCSGLGSTRGGAIATPPPGPRRGTAATMSSRARRGSVASARRCPAAAPASVSRAAAPGAPVHLRQRYTAHEAGVKREAFSVARPRPPSRPPGLILLGRGELRDGQEAKAGPGRHPGEVLVSGEQARVVRHGDSRDEAVDRRHRHATGGGSSRLARPLIVMPRIELHGAEG